MLWIDPAMQSSSERPGLADLNCDRPLSSRGQHCVVELPADVKNSLLPADQWAILNYGTVNLGDKRLNKRAVRMAATMAEHPEFSLPNQMKGRTELMAAYAFLNNSSVTLPALLKPHCELTLAAARQFKVVLMVEDSTELNFTNHPSTTGPGPVGDGKGRGLILHSTLAVVPEHREILGLAHAQVVLRQPKPKPQSPSLEFTGSPRMGGIGAKCWQTERGPDLGPRERSRQRPFRIYGRLP